VRRPELVIFDCDGVLVDSERLSTAVLAAALSAVGLPTSPHLSEGDATATRPAAINP
jgi:beta-phosphoglucomutase-like phosphatase (HAD superfamily)